MHRAGRQAAGAPTSADRSRSRPRSDDGFTLIELMVIVLILGVLLAVALPTMLGSRERAANRRAQAHVRMAYVSQTVYATDRQAFTEDPVELTAVDSSLDYTPDITTITTGAVQTKTVYVDVATSTRPDDTVLMGARSSTGDCHWLQAALDAPVRFASNDCSGPPADADLRPRW